MPSSDLQRKSCEHGGGSAALEARVSCGGHVSPLPSKGADGLCLLCWGLEAGPEGETTALLDGLWGRPVLVWDL